MEFVCLGEALIDFKATGPLAFQGYVGGAPLNVAVAAARLGLSAGLASQISRDLFGTRILEHMRENGLDTSLVIQSEAPSTLAFVEEREGETRFSFSASGSADSLYDPRPRPVLPGAVRYLMFGSVSLLREPAATAITDIVMNHRARCTVVFDPNVRPALIPDREGYLVSLRAWLALADIVKASADDLAWLHPGEPIEVVAHRWLDCGPAAVAVTRGGDGSSLFRRGHEAMHLEAPRVEVADTVGAGDTFTGALMAALAERRHVGELRDMGDTAWLEALRFASAAAALSCRRPGADPPRRREVDAFLLGR